MPRLTIDLDQLVGNAEDLQAEKEGLYDRIAANRRSLRDLDAQGLLPEETSLWLAEFYRPKRRGVEEPEAA